MYPVELSISQTISSPHAWLMASSGGNGGLVVTLKKYLYYVKFFIFDKCQVEEERILEGVLSQEIRQKSRKTCRHFLYFAKSSEQSIFSSARKFTFSISDYFCLLWTVESSSEKEARKTILRFCTGFLKSIDSSWRV